jgi:hypothetical protein
VGFWDEYTEPVGSWVKADEKAVIMDNGIPFKITAVTEGDYKGEPRYVVEALVPNPESGEDEERLFGFPIGTVESRDRMLKQMGEYLGRDDAEPVVVKLEKAGQSHLIRPA